MVERIKTGIIGLDDKIEGGFVLHSVNFVTGKTGTGKTAFAASFLYEGAKNGEPGLYVTTEESESDIKEDVKAMFGWDLESLERKGLIKFLHIKPTLPSKLASDEDLAKLTRLYVFDLGEKIAQMVSENKIKRLVLDSISIIEMFIKDDYLRKVAIMQLTEKLKELKVTSLITGTIQEESEALSFSGIVEFAADSVIKLDFVPVVEEFKRTLTVRKMRRTNHSILIHPFEITREGIKIIEIV
jgi:KaiC/GvpD/RAD55 family RecA-like ATPase